jgi:hypothetical protein
MRTKFTEHSTDACSVRYQDKFTDSVEDRTFVRRGHYVIEIGLNGFERQVCKGLSLRGSTLMTDDSTNLIDVIRREYKIFKREQSKFLRG